MPIDNKSNPHTILGFTLVPVNAGVSLSPYIAACSAIVRESGLEHEFHANGTNIEGPWDQVFETVKKCQLTVHEMGAERIFTTIQLGTRTDRKQLMQDKRASILKSEKKEGAKR